MTDAEKKAVAAALRKLARERTHELSQAPLTLSDGDTLHLLTVAEAKNWLEGWATRLDNGADL